MSARRLASGLSPGAKHNKIKLKLNKINNTVYLKTHNC
jgi:hypothetical protein